MTEGVTLALTVMVIGALVAVGEVAGIMHCLSSHCYLITIASGVVANVAAVSPGTAVPLTCHS